MKYQLIDLGRPREPSFSKTFIVTQEDKHLMVKGGYTKVIAYLNDVKFPCFFGKIESHHHRDFSKSISLISKGFSLSHVYFEGKRPWFRFVSESGVLFKKTRRLPDKWLDCIKLDDALEFMAASDLLEERGILGAANFLRLHAQQMGQRKVLCREAILYSNSRRRRRVRPYRAGGLSVEI